ncbi:hypothetical protein VCNEP21106_003428A, partial [Vibrio cholerae O1 str. Nep-21106]
MVNNFSEL